MMNNGNGNPFANLSPEQIQQLIQQFGRGAQPQMPQPGVGQMPSPSFGPGSIPNPGVMMGTKMPLPGQMPMARGPMLGGMKLAGDVIPFPNPLGSSANQLQPSTLNQLRGVAAQGGLSQEQLKHIIATQMQRRG